MYKCKSSNINVNIRPNGKVYFFGSILTANISGILEDDNITYTWIDAIQNKTVGHESTYTIFVSLYNLMCKKFVK